MQLVVLPGMDGGAELSRECRAILATDFEVHAIEYPNEALSAAELVEHVLERTAALRNAALVAESFSGPIAIEAMRRRPERFAAGVLACTFVVPPRSGALRPFVAAPFFARPPPRWAIRRWMVGNDAPEQSVNAVHAAIARVPAAVMAARVRQVLRVDVRDALAALRMPVLSIRASRDRLVLPGSAPEAHAKVSTVSVDGPHLAFHARPVESADAIRAWLRRPHP